MNYSSKVFCHFGSGKNQCFYDINQISVNLGESVCKALPFFFAFSGCDTVSSIFNQGKTRIWDRWFDSNETIELTNVFNYLSDKPEDISEEYLDIIERFIIYLYDPASENTRLDEFRMVLFKGSLHNNLRLIPPSRVGLIEHVKRASYQGGWI